MLDNCIQIKYVFIFSLPHTLEMAVQLELAKDFIRANFSWKWMAVGGVTIGIYLLKRYMGGRRCPSNALVPGKTVIITGANSGIGKATALELARRKARVILACRDMASGVETVKYIRRKTKAGQLVLKKLDLASLKSINTFCNEILEEEDHIDILVNNAGVYQVPYATTEDGFEMQLGINHLGHFYLTSLLLGRLKESSPSRVVVVSSGLYRLGKIDFNNINGHLEYKANHGYYNSKLANALFSRELSKRLDGSGVSVYCLRPGMVRTNLGRHVKFNPIVLALAKIPAWILVKGPDEGCQTVVYCAVAKELEGVSGRFYGNCTEEPWADVALDDAVAAKLWDVSTQFTGLK